MKVAFDYQIFMCQAYGGISRYFVRLTQELISMGEDLRILSPIHQNRYLKELPAEQVKGIKLDRFPPKSSRLFSVVNRQIASVLASSYQPDILHETYYAARPLRGDFNGRILTVYDMIHEKFSCEFRSEDPTSRYKTLAVSRADHIICISHSTKKDLCQLFDVPEDKISVVHLGFEKFKVSRVEDPLNTSERPYLLYVGSRGGYKNFVGMLKAVASRGILRNTFDLVAFGGGRFNPTEMNLIRDLGFRKEDVRQIGGDDRKLGALYSGAAAFVYPSLYEGFGLPPLEAMAHNCPVVTSNTSSMPEVVGPAGEYFDPTDIDAQAEAISSVVFDSSRRDELIFEGQKRLDHFSWSRCASETRDIYRAVLSSKESR